jgi:hypothetical protein
MLLSPPSSGIPFSAMVSGRWKIIVAGDQISSQRVITLTVGVPQTSWVTVRATPRLSRIAYPQAALANP